MTKSTSHFWKLIWNLQVIFKVTTITCSTEDEWMSTYNGILTPAVYVGFKLGWWAVMVDHHHHHLSTTTTTPQPPPREQHGLVPAWKAGTMMMGIVVAVSTTNTAEGDDHQVDTSIL